jgi:hypothetical protein
VKASREPVAILNVRIRTDYRRLASALRAGADEILEGIVGGQLTVEQARQKGHWYRTLREAADIIEKARPHTSRASAARGNAGRDTRERVIAEAEQLKRANPRLSKTAAARAISKKAAPICGYDQARKYLDASYDAIEWKRLR